MEVTFNALVIEYNRRVEKGCSRDYCQRIWKQIVEMYDTTADWARNYTIRHKDKTIVCTAGKRGRPNYTKQHIIWEVPELDSYAVYLLHIYFEDTNELWGSKIGTADIPQRRFQQEIEEYKKMTGRPVRIHVKMCAACHSHNATLACESRMRNFYIRKHEEAYFENDRFLGIVIDPKQAKRIAKPY